MDHAQPHQNLDPAIAAAEGVEHTHPTWSTYWKVAVVLTLITAVEVWVYYIPSFVASRLFVPAMLIMSAVKFGIVVLFYMHLRYDNRLFKTLFTGPLILAITLLMALMFLFGHLHVGRLG
ncbi:MAG: cytochrome C oxidase subunit IV family protein [Gemmatimonadaceae bacterium]